MPGHCATQCPGFSPSFESTCQGIFGKKLNNNSEGYFLPVLNIGGKMNSQILQLYAFLQASRGNWRNAIWIECKSCLYENQQCDEYLLTADRNDTPLVFSVAQFRQLTGDMPVKDECIAVLSEHAFEVLYSSWLLWNTDWKNGCRLRQLAQGKGSTL